MLKIKDDVDLKILKEYGFEKNKLFYCSPHFCKELETVEIVDDCYYHDVSVFINTKTRKITVKVNTQDLFKAYFNVDIIYDLIADGLVEKC